MLSVDHEAGAAARVVRELEASWRRAIRGLYATCGAERVG